MAMTLYEDNFGHVAKRPRIDYNTNQFDARGGHTILLPPQLVEIQLAKKSNEPEKPNNVLLFTVLNPTYPITCDVLHTISSPIGAVLRIVIFKKNGVQAMVEFDNIEAAQRAKDSLHGCDIYSGCCTLKIEYAKPTKLNVYKNDMDSYDYTNPNLGKSLIEQPVATVSHRPVLLKEPLMTTDHQPSPLSLALAPPPCSRFASPGQVQVTMPSSALVPANINTLFSQAFPQLPSPNQSSHHHNGTLVKLASSLSPNGTLVPATQAPTPPPNYLPSSVTMVYGLNCDKMNCNKLFNLFCLYGNVVRIKFLKTKEGCAMIQMGDGPSVERAVASLNNITFFESKMQLGFSKQAFLADVQQPYELPDSSPSFIDFMGNKNNRFINPEMASKNRIQPPSKILHFFNTPPGLEAADIEEIFVDQGTPRPKCVKMFPSKTERSSSGLIEFENLSEALESLLIANHVPVDNPTGKFPYIMKLCFSSSKAIPTIIH